MIISYTLLKEMTTQIILPNSITLTSSDIQFTEVSPILTELIDKINISATNTSGTYLFYKLNNSTSSNITFSGSGGGIFSGLSPILLFNITGRHIIAYKNKQTILEWTALLQVVINGNSANLSLLQNYAYFIDTTTNTTTIVTITLDENPCLSLVLAGNCRYLNFGCLGFRFRI